MTRLELQARVDAPHASDIVHVVAGAVPRRMVAGSFFVPVRQQGVWLVDGVQLAVLTGALRPADFAGRHAEGLLVAVQRDLFNLDQAHLRQLAELLEAASALLADPSSPYIERAWLTTLSYLSRVAAGDSSYQGVPR
jgi:hypothetical protein